VYETQIVVKNEGESPCFVIPGEFYSKQVLVDFNVSDATGKRCVFVPSALNDRIVLGYVFFKLWKRNEEPKVRLLLCRAFLGDSTDSTVTEQDIETILARDLNGKFAKAFFEAMWSAEKKIANLLEDRIINYLSDKDAFAHYANLRTCDLCDDELVEFCKSLDDYFLLLIQLNSPIIPNSHQEIFLRDNKFLNEKAHKRNILNFYRTEKYEFEFDLKSPLPNQGNITFHIKIMPPEGVKIDLTSSRMNYLFRKHRYFLSWENQSVDPRKFAILHLDEKARRDERICISLLEKLKIQKKQLWTTKKEKSPSQSRSDVRAQMQEDMAFLYFGGREKPSFCNKKHRLLISLNLKDRAMIIYHSLIIALWIIFAGVTSWLIWMNVSNGTQNISGNSYFAIVSQYFWSLITTMLAQSIAAMVDYSRRSVSERFFLKPTLQTIIVLTVLEFSLLIFLPMILPSFAHLSGNQWTVLLFSYVSQTPLGSKPGCLNHVL
jgi:hypothetical protein